jgi:hypothetical protein
MEIIDWKKCIHLLDPTRNSCENATLDPSQAGIEPAAKCI